MITLSREDAVHLFELAVLTEDRTEEEQIALDHLAAGLDAS
jgi:hypothetical protein